MKKVLLVLLLVGTKLSFGAESDKALTAIIDDLDAAIKAANHNIADIERYLHDLSKDKYRDLLDQSMEKKLNDLKRQVDVLIEMEASSFSPFNIESTGLATAEASEIAALSGDIENEIDAEVNRRFEDVPPIRKAMAGQKIKDDIRKQVIAEKSKTIDEIKLYSEDKYEDHYDVGSRFSDEDDMSTVMVAGNLSGKKYFTIR